MKAKYVLAIVLLTLLSTIFLTACNDVVDNPNYTITFNTNEGTSIEPITKKAGESIQALTPPTKEGYVFDGWYLDNNTFEQEFTFDVMPAENITLYAKWIQDPLHLSLSELWGARSEIFYQIWNDMIEDDEFDIISKEEDEGSILRTLQLLSSKEVPEGLFLNREQPLALTIDGLSDNDIGNNSRLYVILRVLFSTDLEIKYVRCGSSNHIALNLYSLSSILENSAKLIDDAWYTLDETELIRYVGNGEHFEVPSTVNKINYYAFALNDNLTSIVIPDTVTSIGSAAFKGCTSLANLTIPDSVTSIGPYAFEGCAGLTNLIIPSSVISISDYAFANCESLANIDILDGVTLLGNQAFANCKNLVSIVIPNSVTSIGSYAFSGCTSLTSIIIPVSVTSMGLKVFEGCNNLTIYTELLSKPRGWDDDWNPDDCEIVWSYGLQNVTYYFVTNGGTSIDPLVATVVPVAPTTTKEGWYFAGWYDNQECTGAKITFPYANQKKTTLYAKWVQEPLNASLSELWSVRSDMFFQIWDGMIEEDELAVISKEEDSQGILEMFESIFEMEITEGLCIEFGIVRLLAFTDDGMLSDDDIDDINQMINEVFGPVSGIDLRAKYARCGNSNHIALNDFSINSILENDVKLASDAWYTNDETELIRYVGNNEHFEVPSAVTKINHSAFADCESLTSIIIGDNVTSIGWSAFAGCTGLDSVSISDSVTSIEFGAFRDCIGLTNISIPNSITSIGQMAFMGCSSLTRIVIPGSVTSIGGYAFAGCSKITIYAEASRKPSGWADDWADAPIVHWDYTGD